MERYSFPKRSFKAPLLCLSVPMYPPISQAPNIPTDAGRECAFGFEIVIDTGSTASFCQKPPVRSALSGLIRSDPRRSCSLGATLMQNSG